MCLYKLRNLPTQAPLMLKYIDSFSVFGFYRSQGRTKLLRNFASLDINLNINLSRVGAKRFKILQIYAT